MKKSNYIRLIKDRVMLTSLVSLILINSALFIKEFHKTFSNSENCSGKKYSTSSFEDKIYSSSELTDEEKAYLYNSNFFDDIIPFVNTSSYLRNMYESHFQDLSILSFDSTDKLYNKANGYYNSGIPNRLFVRDYEGINNKNKDTVAHEFVHLCQITSQYDLITEASAEIISNEYFDYASTPQYVDQVKILKKLMEIIGAYPIWYYNFTGDFSLIEKSIRPYLTYNEYEDFLKRLVIDFDNNDVNIENTKKLEFYLSILYRCKYNAEISDDEAINAIDNDHNPLVRAYFNTRINESYYYDYDNPDIEVIPLSYAMNKGIVSIYAFKKEEVIDNKGPVLVSHYIYSKRTLTYDEYINHHYEDEATITVSKGICSIDSDFMVYIKTPKKVYLTPTFEKNDMARKNKPQL